MTTCPKCGAEEYPSMHDYSSLSWMCFSYQVKATGELRQSPRCKRQQIERLETELAAARAEVERLKNAPLTADSIDKMSRDCWRKVAERLEKENWIFKTAMQYERDHDDGTERGL